jgi:hypothetical protein
MNEEKTTIGKEIGEIILTFVRCVLVGVLGCSCTYLGVTGILSFVLDKANDFEAILSIVLGIPMTLFGLFLILGTIFILKGIVRYCLKFAETEITVKR